MSRDVTHITRQLGAVTHELKSELHGMMQKTDVLLDDPDVPPAVREKVIRLSQQIDRAKIRSEELRVTVRLLLDQRPDPALTPSRVSHTVRSIVRTASIARNGHPHPVEVSSSVSEANEYKSMKVDKRLLELAILNIVDAACSGSREDSPVVVQVRDTPQAQLLTHIRYRPATPTEEGGQARDRLEDFCGTDSLSIRTTEAIINSLGGHLRVHFEPDMAHCLVWLPLR